MPEIVADPLLPSCYHLFPRPEFQESQLLGPDPFLRRGRDARGRFAKGSSSNPRGRAQEDQAAALSRCAVLTTRASIAAALRCRICSRASSPICASASAFLVQSQPNSVPSVPHTMRSAPYSLTAASIERGPNELQSTYTFAFPKRDDGSSSFGVSSRQRWSMRSTS